MEESIKTSEGTVKEGQRQTGVKLRLLRQHQQAGGSGQLVCVCVCVMAGQQTFDAMFRGAKVFFTVSINSPQV